MNVLLSNWALDLVNRKLKAKQLNNLLFLGPDVFTPTYLLVEKLVELLGHQLLVTCLDLRLPLSLRKYLFGQESHGFEWQLSIFLMILDVDVAHDLMQLMDVEA